MLDKVEFYKDLNSKQEEIRINDISGYVDDWYNYILPENSKLSMGFERFDNEMKGKLRSKLCPIIGYGGTKKSLLSQVIAFKNIEKENSRILYSTMEMGAPELINRLIDMKCEGEKFNAHMELEYHNNITGKIKAKEYYKKEFAPLFKDKFYITENTALTSEHYDKLLYKKESENKNIDILIVDGLSGMGGNGSETELYSKNSKELKALANKWKIFIILICHVSKGGRKTDRDLSSLVRSSEKIIDNCDFYITTSLFEEKKDEYNKKHGALRLVNKRGTGNVIDLVYEFEWKRLLMHQTDYKFNDFEEGF